MNTQDLLKRLTSAEEQLAEAEKQTNQLEGRLATLRDSLKKLTGEFEEKSQEIIEDWKKEIREQESVLDALLTEIEELIEAADETEN